MQLDIPANNIIISKENTKPIAHQPETFNQLNLSNPLNNEITPIDHVGNLKSFQDINHPSLLGKQHITISINQPDVLNSEIRFDDETLSQKSIKFGDIVNYVNDNIVDGLTKSIIERHILNITSDKKIILRTQYESEFMRDLKILLTFNKLINIYTKKTELSTQMKIFITYIFNTCIELIQTFIKQIDKNEYVKYMNYCIKLMCCINEFTRTEILKTNLIYTDIKQKIITTKNDQQMLMNELSKNASIINEQNAKIKELHAKIDSLLFKLGNSVVDDDNQLKKIDVETIGGGISKNQIIDESNNQKQNVDEKSDEDADGESDEESGEDADEEYDESDDDDESNPQLSRDNDEEEIIGASNVRKLKKF